ncbi:MAG: hypothetical protein LH650_08135, partial [Chloroflexi bacterium]|nr:hypothetical protein [Chloroflexota bacterium]
TSDQRSLLARGVPTLRAARGMGAALELLTPQAQFVMYPRRHVASASSTSFGPPPFWVPPS